VTQIDDTLIQLAWQQRQQLRLRNHRHCLLLSGNDAWTRQQAEAIIAALAIETPIWLSSQPGNSGEQLTLRQANKLLGRETELLVYDAHHGFDADALGAVSGAICGGGLLLLLAPPLSQWPTLPDAEALRFFSVTDHSPYLARLIDCARNATGVTIVEQGTTPAPLTETETQGEPPQPPDTLCRTRDQQLAVDAILKVATGRRRRPAVLISDRGRGKSSALGIAAATLLQRGLQRIIVTGPRLDATTPVFERAGQQLASCQLQRGQVACTDAILEYAAPDELLAHQPDCDLLLIDEAAAIPMPLLSRLLDHYPRVVFATTVHGYEGTGRGFSLKFFKELDRRTPGWQKVQLNQPIRWAEHDPLERFIFDALLLDAGLAEIAPTDVNECKFQQLTNAELASNTQLLSQVFALLVIAHYRTRPNDLRQLLDSHELTIHIAKQQGQVVGVALITHEGALDPELALAIYRGERRPQGHLIPQSLALHSGLIEAPQLRYGRIMRIAVHPSLQGDGIGSALLQHVRHHTTGLDCLGTSFGVTPELLRFWQRLGYRTARLGINIEQSSGCHSLIMLQPISESGTTLTELATKRARRQLLAQLGEALKELDAELALALLQQPDNSELKLEIGDWQELVSFAHSNRGYDVCLAAIQLLITQTVGEPHWQALSRPQQQLLLMKVLQQRSWHDVVAALQLTGRNSAVKLLREAVAILLERYCPAAVLDEIKSCLGV